MDVCKDYLLYTLLNYFADEVVLANNIFEKSKLIVMREEHLRKLISFLVTNGDESRVTIVYEPVIKSNCCCGISKFLFNSITDILIDKKESFKVIYNTFYVQMQETLKISLDFVLK
jgi:hypothetical protein